MTPHAQSASGKFAGCSDRSGGWGDSPLEHAASGQDAILHLAFAIPVPAAEVELYPALGCSLCPPPKAQNNGQDQVPFPLPQVEHHTLRGINAGSSSNYTANADQRTGQLCCAICGGELTD
jgi:hypothetical protein